MFFKWGGYRPARTTPSFEDPGVSLHLHLPIPSCSARESLPVATLPPRYTTKLSSKIEVGPFRVKLFYFMLGRTSVLT
jgi:hypothetical protein